MNIIKIGIRIQKKIAQKNRSLFNRNLSRDKDFLLSLPEPKDLLERAYLQYLCQIRQTTKSVRIAQNILALVYTPFMLIKYLIARKKEDVIKNGNIALFIPGTINTLDLISDSLKKSYDEIIPLEYLNYGVFDETTIKVTKTLLKRYGVKSPYFCIKGIMKIGLYSYYLRNYNASAIITRGEFSFASSIATHYCREKEILHINIMHGEKLFNIRDSFVSFDKFYVWDQHYIKVMKDLRATENKFIIERPPSVKFNKNISGTNYHYDATYYLGAETKEELLKIKDYLLRSKFPNESICVRFHPTYSNHKSINEIFQKFSVENPNEVSIETSISITKHVISLYSTVLYQAYLNHGKIIIDDISNPSKYYRLKELDYLILKKPHQLLSEFMD